MVAVEEIEKAILQLPKNEFLRLSQWVSDLQQARWDEQIKRDIEAGKLDAFADEALREHQAGQTRRL